MKVFIDSTYAADILEVVRLFFPNEVFETAASSEGCSLSFFTEVTEEGVRFRCVYSSTEYCVQSDAWENELERKRFEKRAAKLCVYRTLKSATGLDMPWGALTGIRPTKLAHEIEKGGGSAEEVFADTFFVSSEKIELVTRTLTQQKGIINASETAADFFVNIPFCVSRCSYCSFVTGDIKATGRFVDPYIDVLIKEIEFSKKLATDCGLKIENLYIGGGTPTALTAAQLERVLTVLDFTPKEFTVEAGRPDTITPEKLELFKRYGVTRVSVNPQTFHQKTLDLIERQHTISEIISCKTLVTEIGFDVNMDLIAGLPDESLDDFKFSLNQTALLRPENLTVHTLALKSGAKMKECEEVESHRDKEIAAMVSYAYRYLTEQGYNPYYLYKQKYVAGNLENVGYCLDGKQCRYNIDIMEETKSVIACGANAISKKVVLKENRVERAANVKDLPNYIGRIDEMLARKQKLFGSE